MGSGTFGEAGDGGAPTKLRILGEISAEGARTVSPPSTGRSTPVTKVDSSQAR